MPMITTKYFDMVIFTCNNNLNDNCFRTDLVINQRLTEPMYSVEGLKFLHQDSHVVMLPKGLPSIGHNVSLNNLILVKYIAL